MLVHCLFLIWFTFFCCNRGQLDWSATRLGHFSLETLFGIFRSYHKAQKLFLSSLGVALDLQSAILDTETIIELAQFFVIQKLRICFSFCAISETVTSDLDCLQTMLDMIFTSKSGQLVFIVQYVSRLHCRVFTRKEIKKTV